MNWELLLYRFTIADVMILNGVIIAFVVLKILDAVDRIRRKK